MLLAIVEKETGRIVYESEEWKNARMERGSGEGTEVKEKEGQAT